jgi:hypothetical protein
VANPDSRLFFDPESRVTRKAVLNAVPDDAAPFVRFLWSRRAELAEWLEADPERAQRLVSDPQATLREALPGIEVPDLVIPGDELRNMVLDRIPIERVQPKFEQVDPRQADSIRLLARLSDSVTSGATTPAQIAADPDGAVRAVADASDSPEAIALLVAAVRYVMTGVATIDPDEGPGAADLPFVIEPFLPRVRGPRPS